MDEIQQLIGINDRASAFEYLQNADKKVMHQIAWRMIYEGVHDDTFIAKITCSPVADTDIQELRTFLTIEEADEYIDYKTWKGLIEEIQKANAKDEE